MKTLNKKLKMKNRFFHFMLISILSLISIHEVISQDRQIKNLNFRMPSKGKMMMGLNLGFLIGPGVEFNYGITNWLSIGISGGVTSGFYSLLAGGDGFLSGKNGLNYGVKLNVLLAQPPDGVRIYLSSRLLNSFRSTDFTDPFLLITPTVNLEWSSYNGARFWFGGGVQETLNPGKEKSDNSRSIVLKLGLGVPILNRAFFIAEISTVIDPISIGFSFPL